METSQALLQGEKNNHFLKVNTQNTLHAQQIQDYIQLRIQEGISDNELKELKENAQTLHSKQNQEKNIQKETLKSNILQETTQQLNKEILISQMKTLLYTQLGIHPQLNKNGMIDNFLKGIIDELIIGNYELAIDVYNTNGKVILDSLKQLASWEGIQKVAHALGESIWKLFDGNAYEKGKSVVQLGLTSTGVALGFNIGKKMYKTGVKEFSKITTKTEVKGLTGEVKNQIGSVKNSVNELVPVSPINFEKMLVEDISKLSESQRLQAANAYLKKELSPHQQKAVLDAHNVGGDRMGAGVFQYLPSELKQKADILKNAGFTKEERRILMEKGICGKETSHMLKTTDIGLHGFYEIFGEKLFSRIGEQFSHRNLAYELASKLNIDELKMVLLDKRINSNIILDTMYILKNNARLSKELLESIITAQSKKITHGVFSDGVHILQPRVLGESLAILNGKTIKGMYLGCQEVEKGVFHYYFGKEIFNHRGEKISVKK